LSESFVTIASIFLELLKKISAAGKNDEMLVCVLRRKKNANENKIYLTGILVGDSQLIS